MFGRRAVPAVVILALAMLACVATAAPEGTQGAAAAPTVYELDMPLNYPQAISVDEEGRFYVLDHIRQCITRFNTRGKSDKVWFEDTGHKCDMKGIMDFALLSGERMYLASHHWNPDIRAFGYDPEIIRNLPGIQLELGIGAAEDGTYYLYGDDTDKEPSMVYAYSPAGDLLRSWKTPRISLFTVGPDGLVYGGCPEKKAFLVYDRNGKLLREIPCLDIPEAKDYSYHSQHMSVDLNGDIYFAANKSITRLDGDGQQLARWSAYTGNSERNPSGVVDLAVRNGMVYACVVAFRSEIQAYTPDGQCVARYQPRKLDIELPSGLCPQPDGSFLVGMETGTHSGWAHFDTSGKLVGDLDSAAGYWVVASDPAGGYYAHNNKGIFRLDANGKNPQSVYMFEPTDDKSSPRLYSLYVDSDTGNLWAYMSKVYLVISPQGKLLDRVSFDCLSSRTGHLGYTTVGGGYVYFADTDEHVILQCEQKGKLVRTIGKLGNGLGEIRRPRKPFVDSEGRVLVPDTRNNRIQVFSPDGEPLGVWGHLGKGDTLGELDRPQGLAIAGKYMVIADTHNDRIVRLPLADFWAQLETDVKPHVEVFAPKKTATPAVGDVIIQGIVTAGVDDFTDVSYIETPDRAWGMRVTLPADMPAYRGDNCKATGTLELKERAAKHLKAKKVERLSMNELVPDPLGMANLYVGDGFRKGDKPVDLSNLGLLVRTWGKVISIDTQGKFMLINDGSFTGDGEGLEMYAGQLKNPIEQWPKVGQYVMVTGISVCRPVGDGTFRSAIRIRGQDDIEVLAEQ